MIEAEEAKIIKRNKKVSIRRIQIDSQKKKKKNLDLEVT